MKSRLRAKIEQSEFSIKEIAEHCGKTQQTFNNYLNGDQSPTIKVLDQVAEKLNCNTMELINPPERFDHCYTSQGIWMGIERVF